MQRARKTREKTAEFSCQTESNSKQTKAIEKVFYNCSEEIRHYWRCFASHLRQSISGWCRHRLLRGFKRFWLSFTCWYKRKLFVSGVLFPSFFCTAHFKVRRQWVLLRTRRYPPELSWARQRFLIAALDGPNRNKFASCIIRPCHVRCRGTSFTRYPYPASFAPYAYIIWKTAEPWQCYWLGLGVPRQPDRLREPKFHCRRDKLIFWSWLNSFTFSLIISLWKCI